MLQAKALAPEKAKQSPLPLPISIKPTSADPTVLAIKG